MHFQRLFTCEKRESYFWHFQFFCNNHSFLHNAPNSMFWLQFWKSNLTWSTGYRLPTFPDKCFKMGKMVRIAPLCLIFKLNFVSAKRKDHSSQHFLNFLCTKGAQKEVVSQSHTHAILWQAQYKNQPQQTFSWFTRRFALQLTLENKWNDRWRSDLTKNK